MELQTIDWQPGLWDAGSNSDYHGVNHILSNTAKEEFRASVPRYHAIYVTQTMQRPESTAAMVLGSALHAWVLERSKWESLFAVAPEVDRRTKAGKEAWGVFEIASSDKTVISQEQFTLVQGMAVGIADNPLAVQLSEAAGKTEQAIRWLDSETGIPCKAKFDRLLDCAIILDVKTASDPSPEAWTRQAANLGYHRQASWYLDGRRQALGVSDGEFLHIVVGTQPPHDCHVFQLDQAALDLGRTENAETMAHLKLCLDTDTWQSRWGGEVNLVSLPGWMFKR